MIRSAKPLSMAEVKELLGEEAKELVAFIKKFVKIAPSNAKQLKKDLQDLGIVGLGEEEIIKIIDIFPEDAEDVRKILSQSSLKQDEIQKILEVVNKYKK
ncbi:MAG: hypothetical protein NZ889_01155 [Candidatus Pacearchaeota archaeon]|nr:hypothetical protein [Candidatus Pacearchaeota archaeon]